MPQQTNLNVSPYFDDFDPNNDYYKVLFKPGYPVQARELTTLQSIFQNQIEKFGLSIYREGAKVIPGNFAYNGSYECVQLSSLYLGIPVDSYIKNLVGTKITGQTSGIQALVVNYLLSSESENDNPTLYIQYLSSSTTNNTDSKFLDGESLVTQSEIQSGLLGNPTIQAGSPFAITIATNSTATGSVFSISNGVYFVRGTFVSVQDETLVLDQYSNKPTYRIGLYVTESIVNSDIDETLSDNAQGFTNYAAPGADRFSIKVNLFKKDINDFNDANFIELAVVRDGILISKRQSESTFLTDELARRTYNESGDYYVNPYTVEARNSLNDYLGNRGVYNEGRLTANGKVPSEDLGIYKISPGKALVRGYEIETTSDTILEFSKPRTVQTLKNQSLIYSTGSTLKLNRVYGSPVVGIGNTYTVSLRDSRVGDTPLPGLASTISPGKEIGVARVYDFALESGSYDTTNSNINQWDISLYDIQTTCELTLNEPITLNTPTFVQGDSSGASAYLKDSVSNSKLLTLYEVSGNFLRNESLIFDGIPNTRVAVAVTAYNISDVKSIYGIVGVGSTFTADVIQYPKIFVGLSTIGAAAYKSNINFVNTTISQTAGVGTATIFISDVGNVSVGNSISIGSGTGSLVNVPILSVLTNQTGPTGAVGNAVVIGAAFTSSGTTFTGNVGFQTNHGSRVIFVNSGVGKTTGDVGISIGSSITVGSNAEYVSVAVVGVGNTYVIIGAGDTGGGLGIAKVLQTSLTAALNSGDTTIFIGSTSGISIGSSISIGSGVGIALTYVPVASIGNSFVTIGAGFTTPYTASVGSAVTFLNTSPIVIGLAATISRVSAMTVGSGVSISYVLNSSRVFSVDEAFPGNIVKNNDIVAYTDTSLTNTAYAKVVGVGETLSGSTTLYYTDLAAIGNSPGISSSKLPSSTLDVSDFKVVTSILDSSSDNSFYTQLPKSNISSVDLSNSSIIIRKTFNVNISGNKLSTVLSAGDNETWMPFDEERYTLIRSDGQYEILTSDRFEITDGGKNLQIYGLGSNISATLVGTLKKINVKSKVKRQNRVVSLVVDKSRLDGSGIGSTTLNNGLSYGNYPYGTRVQDELISLNRPDIIDLHAVYEASGDGEASAPTMVFSALNGPTGKTSDLVVGELLVGQSSNAVAIVAEIQTDARIAYIMKNEVAFTEGETINSLESGLQCVISTLRSSSNNISGSFTYGIGQNKFFYNYGYIKRNVKASAPTRKIKIYFSAGYYDGSDDGDITTVNSYQSSFDYIKDIKLFDGVSNTDIIDIRPRVSNYSVSENQRSPFEFYGRSFNQSGNSSTNILASDEDINIDYSFYLPRIDRLFLTKDGVFQLKYGAPSENPEPPVMVDDAIEIASINLPAYVYNVSDITFKFPEYKRYQMQDISKLETRIKNLEYYTSLSLLEAKTENLFIPDENGLNKFKSGFFVDNFTNLDIQENGFMFKNSIDTKSNELRPSHYTTSVDLTSAPATSIGSTIGTFVTSSNKPDLKFINPTGSNIRKNSDVVTLDYTDIEWLKQTFATRTENVTPFVISIWQGTIELSPASDTWISVQKLQPLVTTVEGNYSQVLVQAQAKHGVDPQTGLAPAAWGSWQTIWTGSSFVDSKRQRTTVTGGQWRGWLGATGHYTPVYGTQTTTVLDETVRTTTKTGANVRKGTQIAVVESFETKSLGEKVVSTSLLPFMRSRNISWVARRVKPSTELYAFFDNVDVTKFCVPKLLEIEMISGTFQVGETVIGRSNATGTGSNWQQSQPRIAFRVAKSNHEEGPYDAPTSTYPNNPYTNGTLPDLYSSTSTVLNIDLYSLSSQAQGQFSGWIDVDMILVGQSSNAEARITSRRLVSNSSAELRGSFFIPPDVVGFPQFTAGEKVLTLINSPTNQKTTALTFAEQRYTAQGTLNVVQENILSVRNASIVNKPVEESVAASETSEAVVSSSVVSQTSRSVQIGYYDPLAESFFVDDSEGIFLTKCDVFFRTKDSGNVPVTMQLRTVELGLPTQKILPFSEIVLSPNKVNLSEDGSVPTTFTFDAPIYLEGQKEYCVVLLSNSAAYNVFISRVGEKDLITKEFISTQPYLGSLFKSQNGAVWEPSQWEDLKFTLYRADFVPSGSLTLRNPPLSRGNGQIANLLPNSLTINSRKVRVGLGSTLADGSLLPGATVFQDTKNATGNYVGSAGSAFSTLSIINPGIGYTPSLIAGGSYTFAGVALTSITGNGINGTADITISGGVAIAATISFGGSGYQVGDVVSVTQLGNSPLGKDLRLSVVSIASTNELILDNVQGDFIVGGGKVRYFSSTGIATDLNSASGGGVPINNIIVINDGRSINVSHKNHGMYFKDNYVSIDGVQSDIVPTVLSATYAADAQTALTVDNIANFSTFESVGVGTTNPGYALVGDEVISYTSISGNTIGGTILRGIDGTTRKTHFAGTPVYKYELGGVSLRRINKIHYLKNYTGSTPTTFDTYTLPIDMSPMSPAIGVGRSTGESYPVLYFNETKSTGGSNVFASQNIAYEIISPMIQNLTVRQTNIDAEIQTVSGKSFGSNLEVPFVDQGFEKVSINESNYLNSTRLLCSQVNEYYKLDLLPDKKSFNMKLTLTSLNSKVSPVIDLERTNIILTSNRVDQQITNYATDKRVNSIDEDPTAFQYITKEIALVNPASSIQIILDAHINTYCDVRAFYAINNEPNFNPIFIPFPGWDNLNAQGQIIDSALSNGKPDSNIIKSSSLGFAPGDLEFKEYKFTANNLPGFNSYRVKIVFTSTNLAYPPRMKNLKVIALA